MDRPNFERLRKVLMLEGEPDRVPLAEIWVINNEIKKRILGKKRIGGTVHKPTEEFVRNDVRFAEKMGYDYIHTACRFKKFPIWVPKISDYLKQYLPITNEDEFERYPWEEIEREMDFCPILWAKKYLPPGMKIISGTTLTGIFSWAWGITDPLFSDKFLMAFRRKRILLEKIFKQVGELTVKAFEKIAEFDDVGAVWLGDDIADNTGLLVSKKDLEHYLFPYLEELTMIARKHNLPFLFHSDGNLWPVMDDLIAIGVNAIHPVQPEAMDINELKEDQKRRLGEGKKALAFLGGINLDYPLCRGTPKEVEELVKKRIKEIAPGGGYALGSSNTIYEAVPFENYKAMVEATLKYGKYPIK